MCPDSSNGTNHRQYGGNWPVIAMIAETDFANNGSSTRPSEVGWQDIPPMWPVLGQVFRDYHKNITAGPHVEHWDDNHRNILVCESRAPIVCFKAGLAIISSRQFMPRGDKEGHSRLRTYCPTTYQYAE